MDCDGVFHVLVRGPFPTGAASDDAVERHLAECPACAEFAEALRPAPDLVHEALAAREVDRLPGYHGAVGCDALVPDIETAAGRRMTVNSVVARRAPKRVAVPKAPYPFVDMAPQRSAPQALIVAVAALCLLVFAITVMCLYAWVVR